MNIKVKYWAKMKMVFLEISFFFFCQMHKKGLISHKVRLIVNFALFLWRALILRGENLCELKSQYKDLT